MTSKIASCLLIVLVNVYSTSGQANTTTAPTTNYRPITDSTTYISTINAQTTGLNTSGLNATTTEVEEYSKTGIETQSPQTSIASVTMSNLSTSVMTSGSQTSAPISSTFTTSDSQTTNLSTSVSATTDEPKTIRRTNESFTINFNTTEDETTGMLSSQLTNAYIKSFLNMDVNVECDNTTCDNSCQVFSCHIYPKSESNNVMLIALVNGITIINTTIDFKSISIHDETSSVTNSLTMPILIGCLSFLVIILIVAYVVTIRKYRVNNIKNNNKKKKQKTQRMKKMTLRHISGFSRKFFNTKYNDRDDEQHLEQVRQNGWRCKLGR
ncbi:uncharacterized protein LOC117116767 [Anneissia japonica]|uniref:uncharacterized protein LOC117116767 n=1 Tax=Anneissia japonica TaxID=1529436 RepID=UPI0014256722|nr:uncharacterized protein LOC117116767 [Anneissia japonica]XP_033116765.1 uncharacterized protein LOC117116767 [Anneissia japonica]